MQQKLAKKRAQTFKSKKGSNEIPEEKKTSQGQRNTIIQTIQDSKEGEDLKNMPIEELIAHEKGILNLFEHALQGSPNREN